MERIRAYMAQKVFGIPIIFVALALVGIGYFIYRKKKGSSATATDTTGNSTDVPTSDSGPSDSTQQPDFTAVPSDGTSSTPVVTTTVTNDTNDAWSRRCISWLMANGFSVDVATSAITKYLNGDALNAQETKARDEAIAQFGLPPESIPDVVTPSGGGSTGGGTGNPSNTPPTRQGTPPCVHTVKNNRDNTPSELAVLYYGTNTADAVNKIKSANYLLSAPYPVGTKVHIPANFEPKYFVATAHIRSVYDIARRNSSTPAKIMDLNPHMNFPAKVGERVRVR